VGQLHRHRAEIRLLPWKPRLRDTGADGSSDWLSFDGDDPISGLLGLVIGLIVVLLVVLALPFLLLPLEIALLIVVLPGFYLLRLCGVTTWPVVIRDEAGKVVAVERHRWLTRALARRDAIRAAAPMRVH
jgi:hypothetical protein